MSLTAFQRVRRMQQVENMKPENIIKEEKVEEIKGPVIAENIEIEEETKSNSTNRRRNKK